MDQDKTRVVTNDSIPDLGLEDGCVVQIYGGEIGRRYPILGEITVGRGDRNTVILELDNVSRQHACFFRQLDDYFVADLGSTNGTRVNGALVNGQSKLTNGDLIKVGGAVFKFLTGGDIESLYHEEIYRLTIVDGLTQVHNKRYFLDFLDREMARSSRHQRPLSLAMFDIDHFKKLNDTYGHLAGDHVLKKMAEVIAGKVRREDLFARYGGEEFVLVLTETELAKAASHAETLRALVEESVFLFDGEEITVTISVGVAELAGDSKPLEFIKTADERLYEAKRAGRNRVVAG